MQQLPVVSPALNAPVIRRRTTAQQLPVASMLLLTPPAETSKSKQPMSVQRKGVSHRQSLQQLPTLPEGSTTLTLSGPGSKQIISHSTAYELNHERSRAIQRLLSSGNIAKTVQGSIKTFAEGSLSKYDPTVLGRVLEKMDRKKQGSESDVKARLIVMR